MMRFYPRNISFNKGFSFLELIVVISIISFLFALSATRYLSHIKNSQEKAVIHQASAFSRMIENVRAIGLAQDTKNVDMGDGLVVYINRWGWPYATNRLSDSEITRSSQSGCESLWLDLFTRVEKKSAEDPEFSQEKFLISLRNKSTCRYKLSRKQEGSFFFDYDINTGKVAIVTPD